MEGFSSSPVMENFPGGRFRSPTASPSLSPIPSPTKTEVDDGDFPIEMDESFNSSMSFAFNDSPPQEDPGLFFGNKLATLPPPPPQPFCFPRRDTLPSKSFNTIFEDSAKPKTKLPPRRLLASRSTFGSDLTNTINEGPSRKLFRDDFCMSSGNGKGKMAPPALPEPPVCAVTFPMDKLGNRAFTQPRFGRRESAPALESPARGGDAMDVDSPAPSHLANLDADLGDFFEESPAPAKVPTKRAFALSSPPGSPSSSSPSNRRRGHDRSASTSGLLFGRHTMASRREGPYKRPGLNPLVTENSQMARASTASAYPILEGGRTAQQPPVPTLRRVLSMAAGHDSDDDTDMDASPSVCGQRRHPRALRVHTSMDGSPGMKPCIRTALPRDGSEMAAVAEACAEGGSTLEGPSIDREEEALNKILPCHKVKKDGLMRITPQTMCDLLDGRYKDRVGRYHVFDCRFDYEYDGGHIDGAINLRSIEHMNELLLTPLSGINAQGSIPCPSVSGQLPPAQQNIVILHCEFSLKRAPTFACVLRNQDRLRNEYPKLHYPEVYVLDGGYKGFFEHAPAHCLPQAYVPMDHSSHKARCKNGLSAFYRAFGRTRSLTGVEHELSSSSRTITYDLEPTLSAQGGLAAPIALAAASAAQDRRGSTAVRSTIAEEQEPDSSPLPCASPTPRAAMGQAPLFGSARPRNFNRGPLQRYLTDANLELNFNSNHQNL